RAVGRSSQWPIHEIAPDQAVGPIRIAERGGYTGTVVKVAPPIVEGPVFQRYDEHDEVEAALCDPGDERIDRLGMDSLQPHNHERIHDDRSAMQRDVN